MDTFATGFERKFLFAVGRHFWNFVAVCGFIAMAVGGILAIESQNLSTSERDAKDSKVSDMPSYENWLDFDCTSLPPASGTSKQEHNWLCAKTSWWNRSVISKGQYYPLFCTDSSIDGKRRKSSDYLNGKCQGFEYSTDMLVEFRDRTETVYQGKLQKNQELLSRKAQIEIKIGAKLLLAGLVAGYGLVVVAVSALNAALLAVERNTRTS